MRVVITPRGIRRTTEMKIKNELLMMSLLGKTQNDQYSHNIIIHLNIMYMCTTLIHVHLNICVHI